jgi:hypothetical protein
MTDSSTYESTPSPGRTTTERCMRAAVEMGGMGRRMVERGVDWFITSINPDVATHLINSNKELLLAMRSLVDAEIRMTDRAIDRVQRRATDESTTPATPPIITPGDV